MQQHESNFDEVVEKNQTKKRIFEDIAEDTELAQLVINGRRIDAKKLLITSAIAREIIRNEEKDDDSIDIEDNFDSSSQAAINQGSGEVANNNLVKIKKYILDMINQNENRMTDEDVKDTIKKM